LTGRWKIYRCGCVWGVCVCVCVPMDVGWSKESSQRINAHVELHLDCCWSAPSTYFAFMSLNTAVLLLIVLGVFLLPPD